MMWKIIKLYLTAFIVCFGIGALIGAGIGLIIRSVGN